MTGDDANEQAAVRTEGDEERDETERVETEELVARIAAEDEELAGEVDRHVAALEADLRERAEEVEDLESRLKRSKADFQNYKKRAKKRQEQLRERATEDLVERLLDVRDNLKRAVEDEYEDVESLREGVEMTLRELDRAFEDEDVAEIAPEPGSDVDPHRHEVMMRVESQQPPDTVADVYQPGYEMSGKVLRAAQVTVSEEEDETDEGEDEIDEE